MRLVLEFEESDGFTYSATHTLPVEYESPEALIVHFMEAAEAALRDTGCLGGGFEFLGKKFQSSPFFESVEADFVRDQAATIALVRAHEQTFLPVPPTIMTIDEWFARGAI